MNRKKITKWISRTTTAILGIVLVLMIVLVISSKASGGEPSVFGYELKSVLSGSMEPTFQTGSIIAVQPVENPKQLQQGDVITFRAKDDKQITHRISEVEANGKKYVTKGDNNDAADREPVLAQNVIAKYTGFTIPYVGYLVHYANTKMGTALMLILPGLLLIGNAIYSIWRSLSRLGMSKQSDAAATVAQNDEETLNEFVSSYSRKNRK